MSTEDVPTPEIDRMAEVHEESQAIGAFLDWLESQGIQLMTLDRRTDEFYPIMEGFEQLLARYYKIDLQKVAEEQDAVLQAFRFKQNAKEAAELRKEIG